MKAIDPLTFIEKPRQSTRATRTAHSAVEKRSRTGPRNIRIFPKEHKDFMVNAHFILR